MRMSLLGFKYTTEDSNAIIHMKKHGQATIPVNVQHSLIYANTLQMISLQILSPSDSERNL